LLGKPSNENPDPMPRQGSSTRFPAAAQRQFVAGLPAKSQKVTFIFNARDVLQSMQINF
jgi:hypothetical protein